MYIVQNSKGHIVKTVFLPGFPALKEIAGSQSLVTLHQTFCTCTSVPCTWLTSRRPDTHYSFDTVMCSALHLTSLHSKCYYRAVQTTPTTTTSTTVVAIRLMPPERFLCAGCC